MQLFFSLLRQVLGFWVDDEEEDDHLLMVELEEALRFNEEEEERRKRSKVLLMSALDYLQRRGRGRSSQFRDLLSIDGMWRRDGRIPREALVDPQSSAWQKLYSSKNDQALITATGFDHASFGMLLSLFEPYFYNFTPWVGNRDGTSMRRVKNKRNPRGTLGRPRKVDAKSCLGLALAWYRFRGAEYILQGWFGLTGTPVNVWLKFSRRVLLYVLWKNKLARVKMPSDTMIEEYKRIIKLRHPALGDVYCFADGLKLEIENTDGELDEQSMFYNGWTHGHYVTNLFVFGADGRIIDAVVNAPGSVHDSTLAEWGNVYSKLEEIYERTGGVCCLDSAFAAGSCPFMLKSAQDIHKARNEEELIQLRQATSLRQAAEWGMHAIQSSFPRLKEKIHYYDCGTERRIYLVLVCLLYNLRLEVVGLNQIRNVYVLEWSKDFEYLLTEW
jgi:DDE superfamily endonuclease